MSFAKLGLLNNFKQPTFTFASYGVPKIANATSVHISKIMIMIDENATKKNKNDHLIWLKETSNI